jgi:hypothetical protein
MKKVKREVMLKKKSLRVKKIQKAKEPNLGGIPKEVLSLVLGECYNLGNFTLKDELIKYGEDIITFRYNILSRPDRELHLEWFHAWTKNHALVLIDSVFGDRIILGLFRNPPKELLK